MRTTYLLVILMLSAMQSFSQEWEPVTPPPDFYSDHTYGFSIDGKGYLVAGTTEFNGPTKAFFQFDPEEDSWTTLEEFPGAARGYGIGDVWDRKAYFGFGTSVDSLLRDLWVFDPDSMSWRQLTSCPCEPRLHPTFVANKGKIFIGLGNNNNGNQNDWWEYDIATDTWAQKPDFPDTRRHHPYMFAIGDYVYTGLGHGNNGIYREWYRYDPATEEWLRMADIPGEGRVAGTQFSYNGKGYVLSGDGNDHTSMETGEMWSYDPELNFWDSLPPHPGISRWAPSSFVIDGVVYLYNGTITVSGGYAYVSDAYSFDLKEMVSGTASPGKPTNYSVYPNPFTSMVYINSLAGDYDALTIYTLDNKIVYQGRFASQHDVSHLAAGMYRIDISNNDTVESILGIKQ